MVQNQTALLVTADKMDHAITLGDLMFLDMSKDVAVWEKNLKKLYSGNDSVGNVVNSEYLSLLGIQFGTDSEPQVNSYIERSFQRVSRACAGRGLSCAC